MAPLGLTFVACIVDAPTERGYARYLGETTGEVDVDGTLELIVLENYCGAEVSTPEDMELCLEPSPAGPGFTDRWDEFEPALFGEPPAYDEGAYADDPYGGDEDWSYEDEYYGGEGYYGASGAVAIRRPRTYVMTMTPFLAIGLAVAATATAPVSVPASAGLLLLGGALVALHRPMRSAVYTPLGPGLVDALWHDVVPTERDASISGSVAQAIERTATRPRTDRCARPAPKTVSAGGTVSVFFCAFPGKPLESDTSSISVLGDGPGGSVHVRVTAVGRMDLVAVMDFASAWDRSATEVQTTVTLPATLTVPLRPGRLMQLQGYSTATVPMFTYIPVTPR